MSGTDGLGAKWLACSPNSVCMGIRLWEGSPEPDSHERSRIAATPRCFEAQLPVLIQTLNGEPVGVHHIHFGPLVPLSTMSKVSRDLAAAGSFQ